MVLAIKTFLLIFLMGTPIGIASCTAKTEHKTVDNRRGENIMSAKTIEVVLKEHTNKLMAMPGVVGTAQGLCDDKPCIKVFVIEMTPELEQKIPKNLEGYPVDIEVTGEFRALPKK